MLNRLNFKDMFKSIMIFGIFSFATILAIGPQHPDVANAIAVQERHTDLLDMNGIVGTAIGLNKNKRVEIQVYVDNPSVSGVPDKLEGIPVHMIVTGPIVAGSSQAQRGKNSVDTTVRFERPVPTGVSTGHIDVTAGTIACRVTDGTNVYALSNNHVYANQNSASIDDPILQPGVFDGGGLDDTIGTLSAYVPIDWKQYATNHVDGAIALTSTNLLSKSTPTNGYGVPKKLTITAEIDMPVKKYGRTSGLTSGKITALNALVNVQYDGGTARFVEQLIISPGKFSKPGDSGSLVVASGTKRDQSTDLRPVGLIFAGSRTFSVANKIDRVLNSFGVEIDGD